jgi:hypothetical protein
MKTEGVADRIAAFRAHCADTEHTDTGGAWDLLNDAEVMLRCAADEMRSKVLNHQELIDALKVIAHWPRKSETVDGKLTTNGLEGLANVRRFARKGLHERGIRVPPASAPHAKGSGVGE